MRKPITPTKTAPHKAKIKVSVLLDPKIVERLDRLAEQLVLKCPGLRPRRSFGLKAAILAGLGVHETQPKQETRG